MLQNGLLQMAQKSVKDKTGVHEFFLFIEGHIPFDNFIKLMNSSHRLIVAGNNEFFANNEIKLPVFFLIVVMMEDREVQNKIYTIIVSFRFCTCGRMAQVFGYYRMNSKFLGYFSHFSRGGVFQVCPNDILILSTGNHVLVLICRWCKNIFRRLTRMRPPRLSG